AVRNQVVLQAHAEVQRLVQERQGNGKEIPPPPGPDPVAGTSRRLLLCHDVLVRVQQRELLDDSVPVVVRSGLLVYGADVAAARALGTVRLPAGAPYQAFSGGRIDCLVSYRV